MIQLFSIAWGILHVHLLLNFDNPSEKITLQDIANFLTITAIKYFLFCILGFIAIFEAAGYLLCYAYLECNIAIESIFWISVSITAVTILMLNIGIMLEINEFVKTGNVTEIAEEESSERKSSIFHLLSKLNLIFLIILSVLLLKSFW